MRHLMIIVESAHRALPTIRFVPDDSTEIAPTAAAEFKRKTGEIVCRERWRTNKHVRDHEIGHALLDHVQPPMWVAAFEDDPQAWKEFLASSVARSYQQRDQIHHEWINNPMGYDWTEIGPDLFMLDQAGRLNAAPGVARILHHLIGQVVQ